MSVAKNPRSLRIALLIPLLAASIAGGCATSGPSAAPGEVGQSSARDRVTGANLADRIEQARSAVDHEQIAAYYQEQSTAAKRMAQECRQVRQRYENRPEHLVYAYAVPGASRHYGHLIESYEQAAQQYGSLAQSHREAANAVRSGH